MSAELEQRIAKVRHISGIIERVLHDSEWGNPLNWTLQTESAEIQVIDIQVAEQGVRFITGPLMLPVEPRRSFLCFDGDPVLSTSVHVSDSDSPNALQVVIGFRA